MVRRPGQQFPTEWATLVLTWALLSCPPEPQPARRTRGLAEPQITAACTMLESCPTPVVPTLYASVSDCIRQNLADPALPDLVGPSGVRTAARSWAETGCLASAADCDAARRCVVDEGVCAALIDGGVNGPRVCRGINLTACSPDLGLTQACGLFGAACLERPSGLLGCGQFLCGDDSQSCEGSFVIRCISGFGTELDCSSTNRRCAVIDGFAQCVGPGPACSKNRCDGATLVQCDHGFERRVRCADSRGPSSCREGDAGAACTLDSTPECEPSTWRDSCDGPNLIVCDGLTQRIDCRQFGFSSCGVDGGQARCQ